MTTPNRTHHIRLTSHPEPGVGIRRPLHWGDPDPVRRGPVIGSVTNPADRNVIGSHGGAYSVYRALAISARALNPLARPDLHNTHPVVPVGPHPSWGDPDRIVSLDPFGHVAGEVFGEAIATGTDIRPTIAITRARLNLPEILASLAAHRIAADGEILHPNGDIAVTKIAIDPVWWLPGLARRFETSEQALRRTLFEQTGGMFPELVTRPDVSVFLPPIGGMTAYVVGEVASLADPTKRIACRVHDECNGSDVFGSDICTCRPYLIHGIEECVREAQAGGAGLVVYNRKEGRALGEVTKFLVYNARKRQEGGDSAATYFERTECVAGVQDARFQQLMPDILHWLGIRRIDRLMSMSNMKYDAIVGSGIEVGERVPIPQHLVPPDASVEMEAKKAAGYYAPDGALGEGQLGGVKGRSLDRY
ncbi:GTP cyclohydrolase II [Enterovirga rhinocerotis]|uniref:GTP cyclohydrolase II /3,4-dihydroxy-2-butanone 4-phosphate synthase n=1 Tax=Enterovirga rhinocerotis TaxID=1339210 RepID=A0A4R7C948_9HYPH|nr:GTP cyclohydrolase II [Enterovirga rhinocerotis]TDR94823.1 GTP cyclohydrolase II /3,4-dihydroxy-2-butanone 4-phosphate synthase [Enterovirga rhinocerotis]